MTNYTKVNIRKDLVEKLKIKAELDNRSLTKYLEQLVVKDLAPTKTKSPSKERKV